MLLSPQEVKKIAQLANLTLTEKEVGKFSNQLSDVLTYIDKLNELDTKNVEPTAQVTGLENVFREDVINESSYVKTKAGDYYKTKAIL